MFANSWFSVYETSGVIPSSNEDILIMRMIVVVKEEERV